MLKILFLKGLPASGKSTYAWNLIENNDGWIRLNKDDLRKMFHGGQWSHENEKQITRVERELARDALRNELNVIIDDTNFNPIHERDFRKIAEEYLAEFEVKTFEIPLEDCIKRDAGRKDSVGAVVIRKMHRKYLMPKATSPEEIPTLPNAIIVDMDGTLAKMQGRGPFEWSKVGQDLLNEPVATIVKSVYYGEDHYSVIIVSGRDKCCEAETIEWLKEYSIPWVLLCMRLEGDNRHDSIVKKEIYESAIKGKYNIKFVIDDRDQVVDLWRSLGFTCLQADYGDF